MSIVTLNFFYNNTKHEFVMLCSASICVYHNISAISYLWISHISAVLIHLGYLNSASATTNASNTSADREKVSTHALDKYHHSSEFDMQQNRDQFLISVRIVLVVAAVIAISLCVDVKWHDGDDVHHYLLLNTGILLFVGSKRVFASPWLWVFNRELFADLLGLVWFVSSCVARFCIKIQKRKNGAHLEKARINEKDIGLHNKIL